MTVVGFKPTTLHTLELQHMHVYMYTCTYMYGIVYTFVMYDVHVLGVLCCFALFVCLTLLASFFLPSHLSFKNMYMYMYMYIYMLQVAQINVDPDDSILSLSASHAATAVLTKKHRIIVCCDFTVKSLRSADRQTLRELLNCL